MTFVKLSFFFFFSYVYNAFDQKILIKFVIMGTRQKQLFDKCK